jgi:hypothetical protein
LVDLKGSNKGGGSYASAYVQLSRSTTLNYIFIMRPFNGEDLRAPLKPEWQLELACEEEMAAFTQEKCSNFRALKE